MKNLAILFSGRGSNMQAILHQVRGGILEGLVNVPCVVTNVEGAGGIDVARAYGIDTVVLPSKGIPRTEYDARVVEVLRARKIDVVALAGFMRIVSPVFVSAFRGRIINVHPADTSAHQGLHGYAWAFEQRLSETWVTVHVVDEGLDTGPVLQKARVDLRGVRSVEDVEARGLEVEHRVYSEAIRSLITTLKEEPSCAAS